MNKKLISLAAVSMVTLSQISGTFLPVFAEGTELTEENQIGTEAAETVDDAASETAADFDTTDLRTGSDDAASEENDSVIPEAGEPDSDHPDTGGQEMPEAAKAESGQSETTPDSDPVSGQDQADDEPSVPGLPDISDKAPELTKDILVRLTEITLVCTDRGETSLSGPRN